MTRMMVFLFLLATTSIFGASTDHPDPCSDGIDVCGAGGKLYVCWDGRTVCTGTVVHLEGTRSFMPGLSISYTTFPELLEVISVSPNILSAVGETTVTIKYDIHCGLYSGGTTQHFTETILVNVVDKCDFPGKEPHNISGWIEIYGVGSCPGGTFPAYYPSNTACSFLKIDCDGFAYKFSIEEAGEPSKNIDICPYFGGQNRLFVQTQSNGCGGIRIYRFRHQVFRPYPYCQEPPSWPSSTHPPSNYPWCNYTPSRAAVYSAVDDSQACQCYMSTQAGLLGQPVECSEQLP